MCTDYDLNLMQHFYAVIVANHRQRVDLMHPFLKKVFPLLTVSKNLKTHNLDAAFLECSLEKLDQKMVTTATPTTTTRTKIVLDLTRQQKNLHPHLHSPVLERE